MINLSVTINGTESNVWWKYGLTQNPFPQIAKAELMGAMRQLNSLDGDQIKSRQEIANRLQGWSPEFIALCQDLYVPGQRITFTVKFPEA